MTGHYTTIDGSEYEVFHSTIMDGKKKVSALMARCTKSQTKTDTPFTVLEANIERCVKFGSWVKIEK
jgi:hypothetical protein